MIIDPEFKSFIPPLTSAERESLEAAIVAAGRATDPLTAASLDGASECTLLDGHNRYEICEARGLPYTVINLGHMTREQAKAWVFDHQIARRNLTTDQQCMLAVMRGVEYSAKKFPRLMWDRAHDVYKAGKHGPVIAGRLNISPAWGLMQPRKPRPPRGPSTNPRIPEGHELAGQSTLTGPDGEIRASWDKTRVAGDPEPAPPPEGFAPARVSTMRRGDGSEVVRWETYEPAERERHEAMLKAWERHAALYAGLAGTAPASASTDDETITLYPLGDPHIGMLAWAPESGEHFDLTIATRELLACVRQLVASAPASKRAIITNLGDFMHAQDDSALTPGHGNKLDVDGRHAKALDAGHALLRGIVDAALTKHAHVTIRNLPGNHDPRVAAELAMWLRAVYEKEPRVTVADAFAAYQYDRFGACLFGWAHGDGAKLEALPQLMAHDQAEAWGQTRERHWHVGHVHHLTRKESPGCVVESHRTLAGRDAWHAGKGYRAGRSLCAITYHRDFGEVARATVNVARVRATL